MKERVVSKMLRHLADVIDRGECGMDDEEIATVAQMLTHRKITIEQAAQYLNISRPTLYRRIAEGKIPEPRKEPGGKEFFWLDELEGREKKD